MCDYLPYPEEIVQYEKPTEYVAVDIHAFPLRPQSPPPPPVTVPAHLIPILKKYPYNWRLDQLSKQVPRKQTSKYVAVFAPRRRKVFLPLHPASVFYSDQLSRPPLRCIVTNKILFQKMVAKKRAKYFDRIIKKSWNSVYNYYKKKERDRRRRILKSLKVDPKKTKKEIDIKRIQSLAQPKKIFLPPKIESKKKKKTWKDCVDCPANLDLLATPVSRPVQPERKLGWVNPAALTYTPTENTLKLATHFERFKSILPPLELGKVNKSALRYNITPRVEELAIPKKRSVKEVEDSEWDPWAIPKNVLRYKATPRILELAKPKERD
ncbi:uncharacterized protein [Diabrotica undecimpunctata]|uniref:uncharacterized protein n=1 Tax=Diabrotica undecimpunctata TaxID=50387 RepID=UPI003B63DAAD